MSTRRKTIARAARLAKMGAGLAGSYLACQLQRPFLDDARRDEKRQALHRSSAQQIRQGLQELRGPVMKLGQALSMRTHLFNPEVIKELSGLQMQAPPMHPTLMRAQFKGALGKYPEEIFSSFESKFWMDG